MRLTIRRKPSSSSISRIIAISLHPERKSSKFVAFADQGHSLENNSAAVSILRRRRTTRDALTYLHGMSMTDLSSGVILWQRQDHHRNPQHKRTMEQAPRRRIGSRRRNEFPPGVQQAPRFCARLMGFRQPSPRLPRSEAEDLK